MEHFFSVGLRRDDLVATVNQAGLKRNAAQGGYVYTCFSVILYPRETFWGILKTALDETPGTPISSPLLCRGFVQIKKRHVGGFCYAVLIIRKNFHSLKEKALLQDHKWTGLGWGNGQRAALGPFWPFLSFSVSLTYERHGLGLMVTVFGDLAVFLAPPLLSLDWLLPSLLTLEKSRPRNQIQCLAWVAQCVD